MNAALPMVFATRNTEYHLRNGVCVAVRDRRSGEWHVDHPTLGAAVTHMLARRGRQWRRHALSQRIGSSLCFAEIEVTTGSVRAVRPATLDEQAQYPLVSGRTVVDTPMLARPARQDETGRQPVQVLTAESGWTEVEDDWLENLG